MMKTKFVILCTEYLLVILGRPLDAAPSTLPGCRDLVDESSVNSINGRDTNR